MSNQNTIAKSVTIKGIGLHTGKQVCAVFKPAAVDTGIVFVRTDLAGKPSVRVGVDELTRRTGSLRCNCIGKDDSAILTVEHLLAALSGLNIHNIEIEIDGNEVPGFDGSGTPFYDALLKAGVSPQDKACVPFVVRDPIIIHEGPASIMAFPAPDLKISYTLCYDHPLLKDFLELTVTPETFKQELLGARTFCLEEEVERLRSLGFGKGASYENTLVLGKDGVIKNKLRFKNEFVRHKVLDLIGDLYVLGRPLCGHIIALKSGHSLNLQLVKRIMAQQTGTVGQDVEVVAGKGLDITQIMKILPHRDPFLFVDRILDVDPGKRIVGIKNVTMNDYFFRGHFPQKPVMPGVIILEAMAQVGGVMMLSKPENRGKLAFFMLINNAKFRKTVVPGDQLVFEVVSVKIKSKTGQVHGTATVDGIVVAEADLMFAIDESTT
ncbi:MAG: UDP-3-O-acyl-N-acetylglucosamine deacetylase [Candidatus Omnitrophica bacterium]|nr:UDP-3-O-acyl-N-acetylglucosamine deacetylase [Candidatus Omnitrophota bacterium]